MSTTTTGLTVSIYSAGHADGHSAIGDLTEVILTLPFGGPSRVKDMREAITLQRGPGGTIIAVPVCAPAAGTSRMFGGRFVYSSDSRFSSAVKELGGASHVAIPLHDRDEPYGS